MNHVCKIIDGKERIARSFPLLLVEASRARTQEGACQIGMALGALIQVEGVGLPAKRTRSPIIGERPAGAGADAHRLWPGPTGADIPLDLRPPLSTIERDRFAQDAPLKQPRLPRPPRYRISHGADDRAKKSGSAQLSGGAPKSSEVRGLPLGGLLPGRGGSFARRHRCVASRGYHRGCAAEIATEAPRQHLPFFESHRPSTRPRLLRYPCPSSFRLLPCKASDSTSAAEWEALSSTPQLGSARVPLPSAILPRDDEIIRGRMVFSAVPAPGWHQALGQTRPMPQPHRPRRSCQFAGRRVRGPCVNAFVVCPGLVDTEYLTPGQRAEVCLEIPVPGFFPADDMECTAGPLPRIPASPRAEYFPSSTSGSDSGKNGLMKGGRVSLKSCREDQSAMIGRACAM